MRANQPSPHDLPMLHAIAAGKVTRDDCDGTRVGYFALYVLDGEPVGRNVLTWLHRKGLISTPMLGPPTLTEDGAAYLSQTVAPAGGWLAAETGKPHFDTDGWCRCCCDDCHPYGCSHRSNPAVCKAHPARAQNAGT